MVAAKKLSYNSLIFKENIQASTLLIFKNVYTHSSFPTTPPFPQFPNHVSTSTTTVKQIH